MVTFVLSGADEVRQALGMVVGAAEDEFGGLGAPNVEVSIVFPGEPDSAVDSHVVQRDLEKGFRARHLRHRRGYW